MALLITIYTLALVPMVAFIGLYLYEWKHIKRTAETYQLLTFISILTALTINAFLFNVFHVELDVIRAINRGLQLAAGVCLWYFAYALLRYQVIPRHKRNKAAKRLQQAKLG